MRAIRLHKVWTIAVVTVLVLGLAALVGAGGGCGGSEESGGVTTTYGGYETTAGPTTTAAYRGDNGATGEASQPTGSPSYSYATPGDASGTLVAVALSSSQKIITDAQLWIEVEAGKFQAAFDAAVLLANRYGGYVVSSSSQASGEEEGMRSGTVAIRVPIGSFANALSDADKFGKVTSQEISTQDVTEEYVDLEARITNSEANVKALLALMQKAKTVDEILNVQGTLTYAQQDLEQLKGRKRYLDEHTSYSTLTMYVYEKGVAVPSGEGWGTGSAFKKALHNFVDAINAIIRGLGVLIPVLIILGIIGYIVYRIWKAVVRRNRARAQTLYQAHPEYGWRQPVPQGQPFQGGPGTPQGPAAQPPVAQPAGPQPGGVQPTPQPTAAQPAVQPPVAPPTETDANPKKK